MGYFAWSQTPRERHCWDSETCFKNIAVCQICILIFKLCNTDVCIIKILKCNVKGLFPHHSSCLNPPKVTTVCIYIHVFARAPIVWYLGFFKKRICYHASVLLFDQFFSPLNKQCLKGLSTSVGIDSLHYFEITAECRIAWMNHWFL